MTQRFPRPCDATTAFARMDAIAGVSMPYIYATGDYDPHNPDVPWTTRAKDGKRGSDCAGAAICYAYELLRHRPGFNHGSWATVSDDINTNSAIEDAEHESDVFEIVTDDDLQVGDLLMYPTIQLRTHDANGVEGDWVRNSDGSIRQWIGHVQMLAESPPAGWTRAQGFVKLRVLQCFGPDGRMPAVMETDAHAMDTHNTQWPLPQHCVKVLRVKA